MTTLADITKAMTALDAEIAPGSESSQWQDYHGSCFREYKCGPQDDGAGSIEVADDFASFWLAVADRDYEKASYFGEVPEGWLPGVEYVDFWSMVFGDRCEVEVIGEFELDLSDKDNLKLWVSDAAHAAIDQLGISLPRYVWADNIDRACKELVEAGSDL